MTGFAEVTVKSNKKGTEQAKWYNQTHSSDSCGYGLTACRPDNEAAVHEDAVASRRTQLVGGAVSEIRIGKADVR